MTADDPRDDVPEADHAEQQQDVLPGEGSEEFDPERLEVDPLAADEADQLEQAQPVPDEEDGYDRP